jgi:hypothetical protein
MKPNFNADGSPRHWAGEAHFVMGGIQSGQKCQDVNCAKCRSTERNYTVERIDGMTVRVRRWESDAAATEYAENSGATQVNGAHYAVLKCAAQMSLPRDERNVRYPA